ncbi:MAG: ABC transporter permease [Dysgonamonadaceae bacterium]|nr:ABC transporter permease [Dysgonamonadaceae bacterium]
MTGKEIFDLLRSWRFLILFMLIAFACLGSIYSSLSGFSDAVKKISGDDAFFFLRLFTVSDNSQYSFTILVSYLGPLLGISLGFDAINSEHNKGTLSRLLSQPVYRDYIILSKFIASLTVISLLFIVLTLLVFGWGLINIGVPPTFDEVMRLISFTVLNIVYVAFWLNLSLFFSVWFRQAATSALSGIAVWLFFSFFYGIIMNLIIRGLVPKQIVSEAQAVAVNNFALELMRGNPCFMFTEATSTLLIPESRSYWMYTPEQYVGALPTPLPLGQSVLMVWPHVTFLVAGSILLFALGYYAFMRREIRSR